MSLGSHVTYRQLSPALESNVPPAPPDRSMTSKTTTATAIPMLDLKRQYATIRPEIQAAIDHVCETQQLVLGEEVNNFEKEMAQFIGVSDAVACASGTDALWLSLLASGI